MPLPGCAGRRRALYRQSSSSDAYPSQRPKHGDPCDAVPARHRKREQGPRHPLGRGLRRGGGYCRRGTVQGDDRGQTVQQLICQVRPSNFVRALRRRMRPHALLLAQTHSVFVSATTISSQGHFGRYEGGEERSACAQGRTLSGHRQEAVAESEWTAMLELPSHPVLVVVGPSREAGRLQLVLQKREGCRPQWSSERWLMDRFCLQYKHNGEVGLAQWRERARAIALAKNPTSAGIARPPSSSSLAGLRSPSVAQGEKRKRDSLAPSSASLSTISSRPLGTDAPSPDPLALQARDVPPAAPRDRTPPPPPARQVGEPPIFARIGHPPRSRRETDDDWCWACGRCSSECTPLDLAVQHSVQGVVKSQRRCCESCRKYFKRAESDLALDQIEATEKVVRRGLKARKALVEASLVG